MRKTASEIIADVEGHLAYSKKKYYSGFYIGITNDVERRLFGEHNVDKDHSWWIYRTAIDKVAAQTVEEHFLSKGMRGDTGGGTDASIYVYCYEITHTTKE
ncbi:MAG: hypothetical protein HUK18_05330 [Bacteroidales bacterium]|nr:hypothetical protein [Bacteroidales bacterium]